MQPEINPTDLELIELANATIRLAETIADPTIRAQLLIIADQVRAMARRNPQGGEWPSSGGCRDLGQEIHVAA
jgi:hypothetical protein